MALNLAALVTSGIATAAALVPDAFKLALVRLGPTTAVDPVTEVTTTTWDVETEASLFGYDDAEERKVLPLTHKQRTFLLNAADYPAGSPFRQTGEIVLLDDEYHEPLETWNVYRVEVPPGGAIALFFCRR